MGYNSWNLLALGIEYGGSWSKSSKERAAGNPMEQETRAQAQTKSPDSTGHQTFYHSIHQLCGDDRIKEKPQGLETDIEEFCGLVAFHEKNKVHISDHGEER